MAGQSQPTEKLHQVQVRDLPVIAELLLDLCVIAVDFFEQDLHGRFELAQDLAALLASLFVLVGFLSRLAQLVLPAQALLGVMRAPSSLPPPQTLEGLWDAPLL